jgi:3'(2'), 5'-bisphosphate nucleotidase
MTDMSNKRIHALMPDLLRIARQAGKAILDVYQSADFAIEHKEDRNPLTLTDRRSHEAITRVSQGFVTCSSRS